MPRRESAPGGWRPHPLLWAGRVEVDWERVIENKPHPWNRLPAPTAPSRLPPGKAGKPAEALRCGMSGGVSSAGSPSPDAACGRAVVLRRGLETRKPGRERTGAARKGDRTLGELSAPPGVRGERRGRDDPGNHAGTRVASCRPPLALGSQCPGRPGGPPAPPPTRRALDLRAARWGRSTSSPSSPHPTSAPRCSLGIASSCWPWPGK